MNKLQKDCKKGFLRLGSVSQLRNGGELIWIYRGEWGVMGDVRVEEFVALV
jgi:hypothetical protein